jgi:hypothetical protein
VLPETFRPFSQPVIWTRVNVNEDDPNPVPLNPPHVKDELVICRLLAKLLTPQKQPLALNTTLVNETLFARTSTHPVITVSVICCPAVLNTKVPIHGTSVPLGPVFVASGQPHALGVARQFFNGPVCVGDGVGLGEGLTVGLGEAVGEALGLAEGEELGLVLGDELGLAEADAEGLRLGVGSMHVQVPSGFSSMLTPGEQLICPLGAAVAAAIAATEPPATRRPATNAMNAVAGTTDRRLISTPNLDGGAACFGLVILFLPS